MTSLSIIFNEKPEYWGFRGDPYFWEYLQNYFKNYEFPFDEEEFEQIIFKEHLKLSGEPLTVFSTAKVEEFAHGGTTSGGLAGRYWIDELIPLLKQRLREYNSQI